MAKRLLAAPLLFALAATAAGAQDNAPGAEQAPATRAELSQKLDESFARVDLNKDGVVDRDEIRALEVKAAEQVQANLHKQLAEQFARLDADKSGQLSLAEFQAGAKLRATPKPDAALQRLDVNKDGKLSSSEYKARQLGLFDRLDANKDGKISADEQRTATAR